MTCFKFKNIFLIVILFLGFSTSISADPQVRVLVLQNQKSFMLSVKGKYQVFALPSLKLLKTGQGLNATPVALTQNGLRLGREEWAVQGFRIEPAVNNDLVVNRSKFRGSVDFYRDKQGMFYGINRIGLEDYLYGVLHHEVAPWWPMDALKAQAVAARTYAMYQSEVSKSQEFDLKSSTSSQVYGGSGRERYRTKKAVDLTKGEVLIYQGKLFPAYFHATCAGKTAGAKELWKIDIPPLSGNVKCGFCRISPHYNWKVNVPLSYIEEKFNQNNHPLGQILKIAIISQTPSGRVGSLRITGTLGEFVIAAKDFRVWIGGEKIRSTNFKVVIEEDMASFEGKGWGHGVGLCQWGALGQALLGHNYKKILTFYYPRSEKMKLHDYA